MSATVTRAREIKTLADVRRWLKNEVEWSDLSSEDSAVSAVRTLDEAMADREHLERDLCADIIRNSGDSEFFAKVIAETLAGKCANCGGDGFNMTLGGPAQCRPCQGSGKFERARRAKT